MSSITGTDSIKSDNKNKILYQIIMTVIQIRVTPFSATVLSKESFFARPGGAGDFNFAVIDGVFLLLMTGVGDTLTSRSAAVGCWLRTAASSNALESS